MESVKTPAQAQQAINQQLASAGLDSISRAQFYRLQSVLVGYLKERCLPAERVIYTDRQIRLLYLIARLQMTLRNYRLTRQMLRAVINSLPAGTRFYERFPSFSSIDSFFLEQFADLAGCA